MHVEGARRIARISALSGVSRFVHVSHLNADHNSPSKVYRHKAQGEDAVKDAFPGATIVRPSWMYGHEDRLLNTIATNPIVFRINHGDTKIKPVHVSCPPVSRTKYETGGAVSSEFYYFAYIRVVHLPTRSLTSRRPCT